MNICMQMFVCQERRGEREAVALNETVHSETAVRRRWLRETVSLKATVGHAFTAPSCPRYE